MKLNNRRRGFALGALACAFLVGGCFARSSATRTTTPVQTYEPDLGYSAMRSSYFHDPRFYQTEADTTRTAAVSGPASGASSSSSPSLSSSPASSESATPSAYGGGPASGGSTTPVR